MSLFQVLFGSMIYFISRLLEWFDSVNLFKNDSQIHLNPPKAVFLELLFGLHKYLKRFEM